MNDKDKIVEQFVKSGYISLPQTKFPKNLLWQPDLIFSKDNYTYYVLVRDNNSIQSSFLNRISIVPKGNFVPLIIFPKKLKKQEEEKKILLQGISVAYFIRGKIVDKKIQKKLSKVVTVKEVKKLPTIDVFVSSKQEGNGDPELKERGLIKETIVFLHETREFPFNPPILIEYQRFKMADLYKTIDEEMKKCEWIIILLEDNYSPTVSYEIKKAIKIIKHENIFVFAKQTNTCRSVWKKEINKIIKLESKAIKFLPYSDLNNLRVTLTMAIKKRRAEICKKMKIKLFE